MPYATTEALRSSLQPEALIQRDLQYFDELSPEIILQFIDRVEESKIQDWLAYHRELVQNQRFPLHAFLELVGQYVALDQIPELLPAD